MATARTAINYTLTTLPANGIVTATSFNSMNDAVRAVHQRGKVVLSVAGNNTNGTEHSFFGPSRAIYFPYGGARECGITFQIPTGYNKFYLAAGLCWPQFRTINGAVKQPVTSIEFRSGEAFHIFHSRDYALNLVENITFQGSIPIPANNGTITNAALALRWSIADAQIGDLLAPHLNLNAGFRYLVMAVYRDEEC